MLRCAALALVLLSCIPIVIADESELRADDVEFFERKIRPLLSKYCYACHSSEAKSIHGGLLLDSVAGLLAGGDSGPVIDAGNPGNSLLLDVIRYGGDIEMPPKGILTKLEIADLTAWVMRGAVFPPSEDQTDRPDGRIDFATGRQFWSFQPVDERPVPRVQNPAWVRSRLDSFVLAAMERSNLTPSPPANPATLIRRLSLDLIGLPPTPEEVQEFVHDDSPNAFKRLVDRLLDSPSYGEKWARFWLDMARYTDKTADWLYPTGQAHLYRDWVVEAFNNDMPFDEFVHRQLATDLLPQTGPDDLPALGLISLSPTYWKELKLPCEIINTIVADEWEERVDAVSRTFLGLTVACARCHDHKFDPISSEDYYALAGVFASCRQVERPLISEAEYKPVAEAKAEIRKLEGEIAQLKKRMPLPKQNIDELTSRIVAIKSSTPHYDTPIANAISEESLFVVRAGKSAQDGSRLDYRPEPRDLPLFIRGNPNRPGPTVPRRFLTVLSRESGLPAEPKPFESGSGRLELAHAITTDAAALTARVIVNRIWMGHFGRGLVVTPSNFGHQGSRPTHPDLLDDLAARFIAGGWSIKQLHRDILLSATWQQSSACDAARAQADPENRWLSRMNRRRLDFESWRDAMLAASGTLDLSMGGPAADVDAVNNRRRTIYATVHRRDMSTTLRIHDFPDPTQHSPMRSATTTPLQGLYALNGPLLAQQSDALSARLGRECGGLDRARIERAYWLLYSRAPTEREIQLGLAFVDETDEADNEIAWKQYTHVLLASNELLYIE
ncbi:MAG: PSD1 and planctomycete cytochrome C domain-containing protein [Planctomycetaceae bacterium]